MKLATEIFIVFCYTVAVRLVSARNAIKFSKKELEYLNARRFGMSENMNYGEEYPQPLPTVPPKSELFKTHPSIYQGVRFDNDVRVYRQRFEYNATAEGQRILCQGMFDCAIAFLAIESSEAIPVLLRGGVGYRHFTAIIKSKPNRDLKGQVRAYCRHKNGRAFNKEKTSQPKSRTTTTQPKRRFVFPELESEMDDHDFGTRRHMYPFAAHTSVSQSNNKLGNQIIDNRNSVRRTYLS